MRPLKKSRLFKGQNKTFSIFSRQLKCRLIIGGEDGVVNVYELPSATSGETFDLKVSTVIHSKECSLSHNYPSLVQRLISLETKGGPIQAMAAHNITKLSNIDLIVADSKGMVTIFCDNQILCRKAVSKSSIECLQILQDSCKYTDLTNLKTLTNYNWF